MDWYEALKGWQGGKMSAEDAIREYDVADVYELWKLALGSGIEIKLGDRDQIAAFLESNRQIDRADIDAVIAELELIVAGIESEAQRLALPSAEQALAVRAMSDKDAQLYIELEVARVMYVDPIDRESGITEAKLARYPERYKWSAND